MRTCMPTLLIVVVREQPFSCFGGGGGVDDYEKKTVLQQPKARKQFIRDMYKLCIIHRFFNWK